MNIQQIRTIYGPNVFSHNPVLIMRLDLEDLTGKESCEIPHFVDRLIQELPGLQEHHCGLGRRGGFVERLRGGTWFGHIVEHVCLELTDRAEISVNRGKTVQAIPPAVFDVAVEFRSERGMRRLLEVAVEYVQSIVDAKPYPLDDRIAEVRDLVERYDLGPSTKAIVDAAAARGIPWVRLNDDSLLQLGYGKHRQHIQAAMSSRTGAIAVDTASDKALTKKLLERAAVPTPSGRVVETADDAVRASEEIGGPVVVKPLDGNQGKGVSMNLRTPQDVRDAFGKAAEFSRRVVVEELLAGRDYRVLVVDGRMVAASERVPARLAGDGTHSVRELIDLANADPRRGSGHSKPMSKIRVDPVLIDCVRKQGFELDDVPLAGTEVQLRHNANLSTGGSAIDVTDAPHPSMKLICERAARAIGLDICGVDLVVPDIAQPYKTGGVVEVNAAPGIRMHHYPSQGTPRDAAGAIVNMLYPSGDGRIPIVSITGTNGKTTVTRLIAHILAGYGACVGMTTTDGIWIDGEQIAAGDTTGPRSAASVLSDPSVDIAVLETARGGIARNGLGYDWSDVGVMTNIGADHIGQDGIRDVEDILRIKALVAERVREGGALVLNADDPLLIGVPQLRKVARIPKRIVWFAFGADNPILAEARSQGGTVYFVENGWILEARAQNVRRIIDPASVSITFGGVARFQTANLMAAVAACRAMGTGVAQIRAALHSFDAAQDNPSRANLFAVNGGHFLFDYGHNTAAISAICETAANWPSGTLTAVLSIPGDRADHIIEEAGRAAARGFDRIILREEKDLRGRRPGEVSSILQNAIRNEDSSVEVEVMGTEEEAVSAALSRMNPGDLVVAFCDDCGAVRASLERFRAVPSAHLEAASAVERMQVA